MQLFVAVGDVQAIVARTTELGGAVLIPPQHLPDGDEVARGSNPLDPVDDPLPGVLSGGGVYTCAAAPGRDSSLPLLGLLLLGLVVVRRSTRRS